MKNQEQDFHLRQLPRKEDIKRDAKCEDCDDKQRAVPPLEDIGTVIKDQETLYLHTCLERSGDDGDLPANNTEPADGIAVSTMDTSQSLSHSVIMLTIFVSEHGLYSGLLT